MKKHCCVSRAILLVVLFILTNSMIYFMTEENINQRIKLDLDKRLSTLETHYKLAKKEHAKLAKISYNFAIKNDKIINILSKAQTATEDEKNLLRKQLAKLLKVQFKRMQIKGMKIFQFTLPDNTSFLRMHKQEKYGDNIEDIRYSFKYVNETKKAISGFEQGKSSHAFRYVYPIFDKVNNVFLGSVELSYKNEYIEDRLFEINGIHTHFLVKKKIFDANIWEKETIQKRYIQSAEHRDYSLSLGKQITHEKYISLGYKKLKNIKDKVYTLMQKGEKFALYGKYKDSVNTLAFFPIKNIKDKETVAWFVTYENSEFITTTLRDGKILRVVAFIVSLLLFYFIYIILMQKETLDQRVKEKTKEMKKYLDIINHHILISTIDLRGNIVYANEALCKLSGYSKDELEGKPYWLLTHPDMPDSLHKELKSILKAGNQWNGKIKKQKKDKNYYWTDSVIHPHFDKNGKIDSYNTVSIDITDKINLEEMNKTQEEIINAQINIANIEMNKAKRYAKAKGEFLANMSHEIRTPLNAILGFIDILKDESTDKKALEHLEIIDKSSHILLNIIEDVLDFSKIESGKLSIDLIYFDPIKEFKIITDLFEGKCSKNNITLKVNISSSVPHSIKTDSFRIKQVISNLLSNAIKFTQAGKNIFVDISYYANMLKISVKDEGKGIASDKLDHIFESFNQEDNSTTRRYGGTGLGLTISSSIVKLLGGKLRVKSKLGKGSEFYFSIPVEIGQDIKKDSMEHHHQTTFDNQKILVAEDNKSNQMLMKVLLKKMDLSYEFADDGQIAYEMFKQNKYAAVLMDENMPNMNGIKATKLILEYEKNNNLKHTPIVALTANALKGDREKFLKAGMDEYLTKPVNKQRLSDILGEFIS